MLKLDVPCQFGDETRSISVYVGVPVSGEHPLARQAAWWLREHGGVIPAEVMDRFAVVQAAALAHGVDFVELTRRVFDEPTELSPDDWEAWQQTARPSGKWQFDRTGHLIGLADVEHVAVDADSSLIVLDRGTATDGRKYWMYLAVPPSKYQEFTRLGYAHQTVRFRDFGKIVRYGYADDVPAEIKEEMRIQYGYGDEHYWWRLDKEINAAQAAELNARETWRIPRLAARLRDERQA